MAVLGKLDITQMENGGEQLTGLGDVSLRETNIFERILELFEPDGIFIASKWSAVGTQVAVGRLVEEVQVLPLLLTRTSEQIVEDVEIPFAGGSTGDSVPLEVVIECLDTS